MANLLQNIQCSVISKLLAPPYGQQNVKKPNPPSKRKSKQETLQITKVMVKNQNWQFNK